jgi:NADPH:quinone reductase
MRETSVLPLVFIAAWEGLVDRMAGRAGQSLPVLVSSLGEGTHALARLSHRGATYSGIFTLLPLPTGEGRAHRGEVFSEATRLAEPGQVSSSLDARRSTLNMLGEASPAITEGTARGKLAIDKA